MKKKPPYDLLVIGAEPAGFAAAACAARQGANVGLIRAGEKKPRGGSNPGIPDFVWRKLNLQDAGLDVQPVSARVSLFEGGRSIATYASAGKTRDALEKTGGGDHHLWADFNDALSRLWSEGEDVARASAAGKEKSAPLLAALCAPQGAAAAGRLTRSTSSLLEDFFASDELKTHLASVALAPFGLGGDEPGSGLALAALSEPAAWRMRGGAKGRSLLEALEEAAKAAGVEIIEQRLRSVAAADNRARAVTLENGDVIRARHVMAASIDAAARADLDLAPAFSPLARRDGAVADIRLRFQKAPPALEAGKGAVYYLADSLGAIADARDAALEGRLIERMPISFEFNKDEIVVHAPYCPAFLKTENEIREWSEQDRQALGMQIVARLEPFLNGATKSVKRIDIRVTPAAPLPGDAPARAILAPPPGHDPIGAAARLALELVSGG